MGAAGRVMRPARWCRIQHNRLKASLGGGWPPFCLLLAPYGNPLYSCALCGAVHIISLVPHEMESAL